MATITGTSGNDDGISNPILAGTNGDDSINGLDGNDTLIGGSGDDTLDGGAGIDTADYSSATRGVRIQFASDGHGGVSTTATGTEVGNDTLISIENVTGGSGDLDPIQNRYYVDTIDFSQSTSGVAVNFIDGTAVGAGVGNFSFHAFESAAGGSGNDTFNWSGTTTESLQPWYQIDGGAGYDQLVVSGINSGELTGRGDDPNILSGGDPPVAGQQGRSVFFSNVEKVVLNGGDFVIDGEFYRPITVYTGDAGQHLDASRLVNSITVTLVGGAGDDTFTTPANNLNDYFDGGGGTNYLDYFYGIVVNRSAFDGVAVDLSTGTAAGPEVGFDSFVNFDQAGGSPGSDQITGNDHANLLDGREGNDVLIGNGGDDTLHGGGNNDRLYGGSGNDTLDGGTGNDELNGGAGNDILIGGGDTDTAVYSGAFADYQVVGDSSHLTITDLRPGSPDGQDDVTAVGKLAFTDLIYDVATQTFIPIVNGTDGDDTLLGVAGNEFLQGGDGNDTLVGSLGDDTLNGGAGFDTADYSATTQSLFVEGGYNEFNAPDWTVAGNETGTDTLIGVERIILGSGDDTYEDLGRDLTENTDVVIWGGDGNDWIDGGFENDTIRGGPGDDSMFGFFDFHKNLDALFSPNDTLDLSDSTSGVTIDLNQGTAVGAETGNDFFVGFEHIIGGSGNDVASWNPTLVNGTETRLDLSFDGGAGFDQLNIVNAGVSSLTIAPDGTVTLPQLGSQSIQVANVESIVSSTSTIVLSDTITVQAPDVGFYLDAYYLTAPKSITLWDPLESTCRHASLSIL